MVDKELHCENILVHAFGTLKRIEDGTKLLFPVTPLLAKPGKFQGTKMLQSRNVKRAMRIEGCAIQNKGTERSSL